MPSRSVRFIHVLGLYDSSVLWLFMSDPKEGDGDGDEGNSEGTPPLPISCRALVELSRLSVACARPASILNAMGEIKFLLHY